MRMSLEDSVGRQLFPAMAIEGQDAAVGECSGMTPEIPPPRGGFATAGVCENLAQGSCSAARFASLESDDERGEP